MALFLWQKQAGAKWLAPNEALLETFSPGNVAMIARPGRARSLVQVVCETRSMAGRLQRKFGGRTTKLPRNWLATYRPPRSLAPLRIGRRLEIVHEPSQSSKPNLIIPVAGAFGTGDHATTAMTLRLLEEATRNFSAGWRLLDAGTGTGILALAARRFGASEVLGLDNDPRAVAHARQNARLNQIARARFEVADLMCWRPSIRYEVITANLYSELLIAALAALRRALRPEGRLIISGILREQADSFVHALRRSGFEIEALRRRGKWGALCCSQGR